ncbi:DUF4087 domain-containing protein [Xanthomonas indica]|uniref:DUF4087 domain-containing protein n=1 Tax=Xanthomonas indica TaxID=2912242 RepID=A0AAU8I0H0_9XANT|nr:DUF4087 domain-containing protein [Xanthomonas indica]MCI2261884.1 DUF4087 domain-containing protein [Xanthomonas indica]
MTRCAGAVLRRLSPSLGNAGERHFAMMPASSCDPDVMKPSRPVAHFASMCGAALVAALSVCAVAQAAPPAATATRCGWFDNPSPGNATLVDRDGEWTVGQQGGHQADGTWPTFPHARWVATGTGSAGYGCACLEVRSQDDTREVITIVSATVQPLKTCRQDKALRGKEPENPLK